jgi:hypothetical protein
MPERGLLRKSKGRVTLAFVVTSCLIFELMCSGFREIRGWGVFIRRTACEESVFGEDGYGIDEENANWRHVR